MLAEFQKIIEDKLFDYEKVLKRTGIKQEEVDLLREKTKSSRCVPKIIDDRNVNFCLHPQATAKNFLHSFSSSST